MLGEEPGRDPTHVLVTGGERAVAVVEPDPNVLGVTYESDAETWLGALDADTERTVVVSVGEQTRGTASVASNGESIVATAGVVETVPDGSDAGAVGALVHEYLSAWDGQPTTVYVEDLEVLLDAVSTEAAFRFLHAVLARADAAGANVVVALDREAYPPHVVDTFAELFDDVRS